MKKVAVIPARGESKGVPKKNVSLLNGRPLIHYAIQNAIDSGVDEVWVSTDNSEIRYVSLKEGALVLDRPKELAEDNTSSEAVLIHFAAEVRFDILVFLQCTSPLIHPDYIKEGINAVEIFQFDSAFSVCTTRHFIWKGHDKVYPIQPYYANKLGNRPTRQKLAAKDQVYRFETGAFYVTTREALLKSRSRISGWIKAIETPFWQSFEVDTYVDLKMIERLMQ